MAGQAKRDPATQCAHVGARGGLTFDVAAIAMFESLSASQTRGDWVAGSSPAMTRFWFDAQPDNRRSSTGPHIAHYVEHAIRSGDRRAQREKVAELVATLARARG